jgi:hypothetical protein
MLAVVGYPLIKYCSVGYLRARNVCYDRVDAARCRIVLRRCVFRARDLGAVSHPVANIQRYEMVFAAHGQRSDQRDGSAQYSQRTHHERAN